MSAKRFFFPALGLFALLVLGAPALPGADASQREVRAARAASLPSGGNVPVSYPDLPLITPTPALPDYVPYIAWDPSYPCPYPVLEVGSRNQGAYVCWTFTMRLENSAGQYRDFTVPNESFGYVTYTCQIGSCVPYSWLYSMPYTLTVDYGNALPETNDDNNTAVFTTQPPQPQACGIDTRTPTPTALPSSTATRTHTIAVPNLVGSAQWVPACPIGFALEMRTQNIGDNCTSAGSSHTQLQNNRGETIVFPVPPLAYPGRIYDYDCPIGSCLPDSWLTSMPFTLTVDVYNEVWESYGENDNVSTFNIPPPPGNPCGTPTPTMTAGSATLTPSPQPSCTQPTATPYPTATGYPILPQPNCTPPTGTPYPTASPYPSYTPYPCPACPTHTPTASATPSPTSTYTSSPTYTHTVTPTPACALETFTPNPTYTPVPTYTPSYTTTPCGWQNPPPTYTRNPTYTPHPTYTPYPTYTPAPGTPTDSPTPTPSITPTCRLDVPDLVAGASWSYQCWVYGPTLSAWTSNLAAPAPATTMRLTYGNGAFTDYAVPPLNGGQTYRIGVPWHSLGGPFPITVTVDYFNVVVECREDNNTILAPDIPPTPTPCGTQTAISTSTWMASPTPGSPTTTPCAVNFVDVQPSDYFYGDVRGLACLGAISGYADGTFRPFNNTTRGQICKIVVIAFNFPIDTHGGPHFSDVPPGSPFYNYIETAYNRGIVSGYSDGTFRLYNYVTRAQLVKIICRAIGWPLLDPPNPAFSDVPPGSPFYEYIETAICQGIISGYSDGTFRPGSYATRAQVSKIVLRAVLYPEPCSTPTPTR